MLMTVLNRIGIVQEIRPMRCDTLSPYHTVSAITRAKNGSALTSAGIDLDPKVAIRKAFSEALERYCLANRPTNLVRALRSKLPGESLSLNSLGLFTKDQYLSPGFPYQPCTENKEYEWCQGIDLATGEPMWVPADLVWLHCPDRISAGVSTGAASHCTREDAIVAGLLEVIERDGLTIVWESRATTPKINVHAEWQFEETKQLAQHIEQMGHKVILRDITTDIGIPTVLTIIQNQRETLPAMAVGAAAGKSFAAASVHATREAFLTWMWMYDEHKRRNVCLEDALRLAELPDALMWQAFLYGFDEMLPEAKFLFADADHSLNPEHLMLNANKIETDALIKLVVKAGYRPIVVDIAQWSLPSCGVPVFKVIVPGLVPLSIGRHCRHLANTRIYKTPASMASWQFRGPLQITKSPPIPLP